MKLSITIISLLISFSVLAAADRHEFSFKGSRNNVEFELNSEDTHTEYRDEMQRQTCTRRVIDHYEPYCYYRTVNRCFRNAYGQVICRPVQQRYCESRPVYRDEHYTCYRNVRVPYEVLDYLVDANFTFSFGEVPRGVSANENFTVDLNGDQQRLSVRSGQELLILKEVSEQRDRDGDNLKIDFNYQLNFMSLKNALSPISRGILDLKIENGNLSFLMGKRGKIPVDLSLYLERIKIGRNPILINRNLKKYEYTVKREGEKSRVTINLNDIVKDFKSHKKHNIRIDLKLNLDINSVVNRQDLVKDLKISRELKYRP